jgi:hypothetical protein
VDLVRRLWRLLPAEARTLARHRVESVRAFLHWACFWRWRLALISTGDRAVVFFGQECRAWEAAALLGPGGVATVGARRAFGELRRSDAPIVSDAPIPGALRVPRQVRTVYPTHSGLMKLPRRRRILASQYWVRRAVGDEEIEHVYREFLVPFAVHRHGTRAVKLSLSTVKRIAESGRLDLLSLGDEVVGAHLGFSSVRRGKRYWEGCRVGYSRRVFENPQRMADLNAITFFVQLHQAEDAGFDFYDLGESLARPEGGLLQSKKRMGGVLAPCAASDCFWVRLPPAEAPMMLWEAPLFSQERRGLLLHVGLLVGLSDVQVVKRYRDLAFQGLAAVRIHASTMIPETTLEAIRRHFHGTPVEVADHSVP